MTLLNVQDLALATAHKTLVHGLSMRVDAGATTVLIGESGSGKTLSALACAGLLPPAVHIAAGSIHLQHAAMTHASEAEWNTKRGKDIGFIFQEPMTALNPLHTIERQVGEAAWLRGVRGAALQQAIAQAIEMVELPQRCLKAYPHQLSGGQRQRVLMAAATINKPALLIADEPTTALDAAVRQRILACLQRAQRAYNSGFLIITHDLRALKPYADMVYVLHNGRMVEAGAQVLVQPQQAYTQQLLQASTMADMPPLSATHLRDEAVVCAAHNVAVRYKNGVQAVHPMSLHVHAGETLGIAGGSGSGKSTLAQAILQLIPHEGQVEWQQCAVSKLSGRALRPLRRHVQAVFQDPFSALSPRMSAAQIIAEGLRVHEPHLTAAQIDARVVEVLHSLQLNPDDRHRYPHEFSGGQRQRIAIAAALVLAPKVIVFDEPTGALDPTVQENLLHVLRTMQQQTQIAYIFISHDLTVLRALAHRVLIMDEGRVVESGTTQQVLTNPQHSYTQQLVAAAA